MIQFQNLYYDSYLKKYRDKKIIVYGVGGTFRDFLDAQKEKVELMDSIAVLLDGDSAKRGMHLRVGSRSLTVESVECYAERPSMADDHVMILFLADRYISDVLRVVDQISAFDHMVCLYGLNCLFWGREPYRPPYPVTPVLPECGKRYEIPKKIHYCWFGKGPIPEKNLECIDSWHGCCPDYEIILWNESTIEGYSLPEYVREAYKARKYAFVSDYVRLLAVYRWGGFYFDTDVFLLKRLDKLRQYRSVYAFMEYGEIATGLGFGSVPGTAELKELMELYQRIPFYDGEGSMNLTPCPRYTNDFFRRRNIRIDNSLQLVNDMVFLPSSYFCPLIAVRCEDGLDHLSLYALEDNTMGIHLCDNSWKEQEDRKFYEKKKGELLGVNRRLLSDWKLQNKETDR